MAGQKRDAKWLKEQLSRVLGWDDMIVEGLVDTIMRAAAPGADRSELDEMVENFMADCPAGIALINDFLAPPTAATAAAARGPGGGAAAATAATGAGKSYAASASSSHPSAAAPGGRQQSQQQQQGHHGRTQRQQQQQHSGAGSGAPAAAGAAASAAPPGWQALSGPGAAAASARAGGGGGGAAVAEECDDFSRFVVDDRAGGPGGGGGGKGAAGSRSSKPGSSRDLQALEASAAGAEKPGAAANAAGDGGGGGGGGGKVLGMFKAGGRIKTPTGKAAGVRGPEGGAMALAASLERQVINCLGCGKIYDCRSVSNDIIRFLDRGGVCTYCGDTVPLTYKDRRKAAEAAAEAVEAAAAAAAAGGAAGGAEDAATVAARAFKDRLVEYDRNAAKRTTVIDDQSDFFEIDTNAWLSDQERDELRRRRRMEEEAEAARRKRLSVTIDLIGRKVVLDEDVRKAEEAAAVAAVERAAMAAKAAAAAEALRSTDGNSSSGAYGGGVAFSGNALGGSAGSGGPTQQQLTAALDALRHMKASLNPAVAANAAPLFLPTNGASAAAGGSRRFGPAGTPAAAAAAVAAGGSSKGGGGGGGTSAVAGAKAGGKGATAAGGARPTGRAHPPAAPPPRRHERVQHDLGAEFGFDAFGAEVALDELMGGAVLAAAGDGEQQDGPYDICPPDMAPSTSYSGAAKAPSQRPAGAGPRPTPGLPPGVVLLKGYLTMDEQIHIIQQIRELGTGPGGFYIPSYSTGGRLNLQMMCLGLHWEPRTGKYETTRSSYDGATPPPIPPWLVDLCGRCQAAASAAAIAGGGSRFPPLQPDICLANFYERSGRLGMHQDKDEMPDSLRAGLPVVSLSLGDAADFLYGSSRDPEEAASVRLESGDLLVFGGPGRMIFHSVAKIHPHTAPQELIRATGLRPGRLNLTFRKYKAA